MQKPTHIIGEKVIRLEIDSRLDAFSIQQDVSWILRQRVLPRLEALFDRLVPPDVHWRLDTLELFLEDLDPEQLESQLTERVIEAVENSILNEKVSSQSQAPLIIRKQNRAQTTIELWFHFLENASLPWWFQKPTTDAWEPMIIEAIQVSKEALTKVLPGLLKKDIVRRRLFWQFSEKVWEAIVQSVQPDWFQDFQEINKYIRFKLPEAFRKAELAFKDTQNTFWEISLLNLFQIAEKKEFVQNIVLEYFKSLAQKEPKAKSILVPELDRLALEFPEVFDQKTILQLRQNLQLKTPFQQASKEEANISRPAEGVTDKKEEQLKEVKPEEKQSHEDWMDVHQDPIVNEEGIYVQQAGVIILHPFLLALFSELGYIEKKEFKSEEARFRAIHLLQYLATGELDVPEYELTLNKFICGMPLNAPVPRNIDLSVQEKQEADHLLGVIIGHWKALKGTSIDGLRYNYFVREGRLFQQQATWKLQVEDKTQDILLNKLPWGIGMVQLPWMKERLTVEWAY